MWSATTRRFTLSSIYTTDCIYTTPTLVVTNIYIVVECIELILSYFLDTSPHPDGWTRGARPRGNLLYGQTWLETPDPVRSPKLSNHGRVQYSRGGPAGKRTYCTVSILYLISLECFKSEVRTECGTWAIFQPPTWVLLSMGQPRLSLSSFSCLEG